jgi:hypothetical protein
MRRPLAFSLLAVLSAAVLARATPPKDPPPELLDTACSSGLLLQPAGGPSDAGPGDEAAPDSDSAFADSGLFGDSDDKDGGKDEKKEPAKKKPKTKLLRPRSDKDKADCPAKVGAFYREHGGRFNAVPAPANLSAEQIEGNLDRAYAASFGPAKGGLMTDLKGEDISKKWDVVNKIFDGIGPKQPLDDAAFGVTVSKNLHNLVNDKVIRPADLGGKTPEELAAAPKTQPAPPPAPLDPKAPNDPRSPSQLAAEKALKTPPSPTAIVPPARPMDIPADVVPQEPGRVRQFYNNFKAEVGDFVQGSPIAKYEGERTILPNPTPIISAGGDQRINVRLPQSTGITPRCEPGCYGTQKMIALLVGMGEEFSAYYQGKRTLSVGGISKRGGGYFPPHVSHQKGVDADVSFQNNGGFDVAANAMIVAAVVRKLPDFRHINAQEYILCDQSKHAALGYGLDQLVKQGNLTPEQAARGKSVLQHWPGHNDHFHIRILP